MNYGMNVHEENTEDFFKILIKKSYAAIDILKEYVFKYRTFICATLQLYELLIQGHLFS